MLVKTLFIAHEDVGIKLSRDGEESVPELGSTPAFFCMRHMQHHQAVLPVSPSLKIKMYSYYAVT